MEFHESSPSAEFDVAFGWARTRFYEAVMRHNPLLRHFLNEEHPETLQPMAAFLLAERLDVYDLMTAQHSEQLLVSVPAHDKNDILPMLADDQFFMVGQMNDLEGRTIVTPENYDDLFVNTDQPVIADLSQKLATYKVVPIRISLDLLDD